MRTACLLIVTAAFAFCQNPENHSSGDDRAWETLDRGLHDGNPVKRIRAVLAMASLRPGTRPVSMLENELQDKDRGVREAACATLGELKPRSAIPKLQAALDDSAPEVIFAAARALYAMGDSMGREVLTEIVLGEQSGAPGFISGSLHKMKLKMHDPKALLLLGAKEGVGLAGPFGLGFPIAEGLLKDSQASGKTVAVLLLATDTSPESIETLKSALADKNWTVRVAAARAIAKRDARGLYPDVAALLDDKREEVQYAAAATLIRLQQASAGRRPRPTE